MYKDLNMDYFDKVSKSAELTANQIKDFLSMILQSDELQDSFKSYLNIDIKSYDE